MATKKPLKFDFDSDNTPSAVAEFTASDVVSASDGGTGFSSLALLATNLSSTDILSTSVSSHSVSAVNFFASDSGAFNCMGLDGQKFFMKRENGGTYENLIKSDEGTITIQSEDDIHFLSNAGEKFMRLNESGGNGEVELYYNNSLKLETTDAGLTITGDATVSTSVSSVDLSAVNVSAASVSATSVSSLTIGTAASSLTASTCPIPHPFAYAKLDDDGTAATTETNIGAGATITQLTSNAAADIAWDDSNDYFTVKKAGIYELTARVVLEVATTTVVTLKIKTGGTVHNTFAPKINSAVDPQEATLHAVFTAAASDNISVTHTDDASTNVNAGAGTTLILKRLL